MHDDQLKKLLRNSRAVDAFKQAVQKFARGEESELIQYSAGAPKIKILRVILKLLESYPNETISSVTIRGVSTCSSFHGELSFSPSNKKIKFNWDCRWKAEEAGLTTWYGAPDQSKAAQVFGYQCFRQFHEAS